MNRPQLSIVVNQETGEVYEGCAECAVKDDQLEGMKRENASLAGRLTKARNENAQLQGIEPGHDDVLEVLEWWRKLCMPQAKITVGSERWRCVRTLLKQKDAETDEPAYSVAALRAAAVGATLSEWHVQHRQLDAATIYRDPKTVDRHIARAVGFKRTYGTSALELVDELAGSALYWLAERCSCGHFRLDHVRQGPTPDGRQPCDRQVPDEQTGMPVPCSCRDFDWLTVKWERKLAELQGERG